MPRNQRRSGSPLARAAAAIVAVAILGLSGCAANRPAASGPAPAPGEVYHALLGRNSGLTSLRAVAEARLSFVGREVSLPGVLVLDSFGGFRLDLLDPLDRPLAILFAEGGRIVHYRPGPGLAASLGVFPEGCRGVDPADWVPAILASSIGPVAGERLVDRGIWGAGRVLELHRDRKLRQSVRYRNDAGQSIPRQVSWYCEQDVVLQVRLSEWVQGPNWRLPSRFEIEFPKAGLAITLELAEIEANPPPSNQPLHPQLGSEIRWTAWNLPQ
ncbi:MAG: hypothetical protein ACYC9Y_03260 [Candidatus Methylomirabilia bacterium]